MVDQRVPPRDLEVSVESNSVSSRLRRVRVFLVGLTVGAVVAGVGLFFFVDMQNSDASTPKTQSDASSQTDAGRGFVGTSSQEIHLDVAQILEGNSSVGRAVMLQSLLARKSKRELQDLFSDVESVRPIEFRDEIQTASVRRLAQSNPKAAVELVSTLARIRRNRLTDIIFEEWSVVSLEEALDFAKNMEATSQTAALEGILRSRIDLSDVERRDIATQLGNEQLILDQWALLRSQDVIDDPQSEWDDFLTTHGHDAKSLSPDQRGLLAGIARSWIGRDGFGEMAQQMNASLEDYDATVSIVELLLEEVVGRSPDIVLEAARGMSPEVQSIILHALSNYGERDPKGAYEIARMMEASGDQIVFKRAAIGGWMESDPKGVLEARFGLPDEFRSWIEQWAVMTMIQTMPEEVPALIPSLGDEISMEIIVTNLSTNWARQDPKAVFEWLKSEPKAHEWYDNVLSSVIVNLAKQDVDEAFRIALEQPPRDYDGIGWEASVVRSVAHSDVDAAVALTDRARDEATRESMLEGIGQVLINQAQYERAMDWAQNLKAESREDFLSRMVSSWVWSHPERLYDEMDSLPSDELREQAAEWLIEANEHTKAFDEEKVSNLKKYLPEESNTQENTE